MPKHPRYTETDSPFLKVWAPGHPPCTVRDSQVWPKHSEKGKKTRQTEEDLGRQHQGMDGPGVRQVPEGSAEQGKMEEIGREIICGGPTTLAVKG